MPRTSSSQFQLLVEFMERNGDLSKPTEGPQGRATNIRRWSELAEILNADATGDSKTAEKWRKVWSDFKNNTKKKAARIYRVAQGTGGGPASNLKLTDLEERVLGLVGSQAATDLVGIPEVGLEVEENIEAPLESLPLSIHEEAASLTWNQAGPSCTAENEPVQTPAPVPEQSVLQDTASHAMDTSEAQPGSDIFHSAGTPLPLDSRTGHIENPTPLPLTPRRRRRGRLQSSPIHRRTRTQTQSDLARQAFVRSDCEWRAFQQETEREKIRLRELELRMQERWLDLMQERWLDLMQERWLDLMQQFLVVFNRIADNVGNR